MIRLAALALLLLCAPVVAAERPASPILQFRDWLWPERAPLPPPQPPRIELPAPPAPPPVAKPPPAPEKPPAPAVKPKRPADKSGEKIDKPRPTPVKRSATMPPGVCDHIRAGIVMIGRAGVIAEARRRGYSAAQIARAIAACGV